MDKEKQWGEITVCHSGNKNTDLLHEYMLYSFVLLSFYRPANTKLVTELKVCLDFKCITFVVMTRYFAI